MNKTNSNTLGTITPEQLIEIRNVVVNCVQKSSQERTARVIAGNMTNSESEKIAKDCEEPLQEFARYLNSRLLKELQADANNAGNRIITATRKLDDAIAKLESVQKWINIFTSLTNITTQVITAIISQNPLVIADSLTNFEKLLSNL